MDPTTSTCSTGPPSPGNPTDYLWKRVLTRDGLTNILENYAQVVETKHEKTGRKKRSQIWPRYHQLDVVRKLLGDVQAKGVGQRYLIQHSAGSGKSKFDYHRAVLVLRAICKEIRMNNVNLRIGMIGAGAIAREQAGILQKMPGVRVVALSGRGADRGRKLAEELGAEYYTDVPAMLSGNIDAVSICTPHAFHCEGVLVAAAAGKHVLVEKPMGCTVDECDQMIAACRGAGVTLMVGQTFRFQAETSDIRRLIDEGKLGDPVVAIDVTAYGNLALTPWYFDAQIARGGLLMSSASHRIYRLHYLVQSPIVEVHARLGTFGHAIETEDTAVLSLRFANGMLGTIVQSCLDYIRPAELSLQLQGTRGAIRLRAGGALEYWGAEHAFQIRYERDNAMQRELAEFVAAIRDRRPPAVPGEDGRAVVAVLEAAYHSAASGRAVAVVA